MGLKHWAVLGLFVGGLGTAMTTLHSWQEAATPQFVGGVLLQLGSVIAAMFTEKPTRSNGSAQ